jgi:hypothetical protein
MNRSELHRLARRGGLKDRSTARYRPNARSGYRRLIGFGLFASL